jgi:Fe-S oxidoreductase
MILSSNDERWMSLDDAMQCSRRKHEQNNKRFKNYCCGFGEKLNFSETVAHVRFIHSIATAVLMCVMSLSRKVKEKEQTQ